MAEGQLATEARVRVKTVCARPSPLPFRVLICSEQAFYSCSLYIGVK